MPTTTTQKIASVRSVSYTHLQRGNDFALQVAAGQRIVRLDGHELLEMSARRDTERFHQLPRREIRASDVTDLALADQIGESAERFLERRQCVEIVDLVEILSLIHI